MSYQVRLQNGLGSFQVNGLVRIKYLNQIPIKPLVLKYLKVIT
jgi:hypothetical protein